MKRILALVFVVLAGLSWYINVRTLINEPKEYKEHLERAESFEEKGIYVDAIKEYEDALKYDPDNAEIKMRQAYAYLSNENTSKFVSLCEEIAEKDQDNTEALDALMQYYMDQDANGKAVKYLKEYVSKYPDNENAIQWFTKLKGSYSKKYCWYSDLSGIYNEYFLISQDDLWGIADADGSEVIDPEFDEIQVFSTDGYALAKKDGKYLYIDKKGQTRMVPDAKYQNLGMFSSGCVCASKNGKYGLLDQDMEPITKFDWNKATSIYNNVGAACKNGKWALIDEKGKCITDYIYDDVVVDEYGFCNRQGLIFVKADGKYKIVNEKGKSVGKLTFEDAKCFNESGYAAVCNNGKWGYVDEDGSMMIEYSYDDAQSFSNGYAAVRKGEFWGYIDTDNNLIIDMNFTDATSFSKEGTAVIEIDGIRELIQLDLYS